MTDLTERVRLAAVALEDSLSDGANATVVDELTVAVAQALGVIAAGLGVRNRE